MNDGRCSRCGVVVDWKRSYGSNSNEMLCKGCFSDIVFCLEKWIQEVKHGNGLIDRNTNMIVETILNDVFDLVLPTGEKMFMHEIRPGDKNYE